MKGNLVGVGVSNEPNGAVPFLDQSTIACEPVKSVALKLQFGVVKAAQNGLL